MSGFPLGSSTDEDAGADGRQLTDTLQGATLQTLLDLSSTYPYDYNAPATVNVWVGSPDYDTCHTQSAFGDLAEAESGCGLIVARDGLSVPTNMSHPNAVMVAGGLNKLFVKTSFDMYNKNGEVERWAKLSLKFTSSSSNLNKLCNDVVVTRPVMQGGIVEMAIDQMPDPEDVNNPGTLVAGEMGNVFSVIPFAKAPLFGDETLTLIVVPFMVNRIQVPKACKGAKKKKKSSSSSSSSSSSEVEEDDDKAEVCFDFNVTSTRLNAFEFTVGVRTEPRLENTYPEFVENCFYAAELTRSPFIGGGIELDREQTPSGAKYQAYQKSLTSGARASAAAAPGMAIAAVYVAWLTARGLGRRC